MYNFTARVPLDEIAAVQTDLNNQITFAPLAWGGVERTPGEYDWEPMEWWAKVAEVVPALPDRIWTIYPVHMNERGSLPPDLQDAAFDSREMIDRFDAFVKEAAPRGQWNDGRTIVMVGNEIDSWAKTYPDEVDAYVTFSNEAAEAIRRHAPTARVVNSLTADVLDDPATRGLAERMNEATDLIALQWYDLRPDFCVRKLTDLAGLVEQMLAVAGDKPLLISEIGLPTGAGCESSDDLQAERVRELFDVLSRYDRSEIEGAVWLGLDDWPVQPLEEYVAQQFPMFVGNVPFLSFLTSLGLRDVDKRPKAAYEAWKEAAAAAGVRTS
jgi:hypothetical protein